MSGSTQVQEPGGAPLVTVIIGSYHHERFLPRALAAAAAQTYPHIQLIVTDDASSDGSADLIEAWLAEHRPAATFIRHEENAGVCRTANEALAIAEGEYVTAISADDWMEPHRLERLVEVFGEAPETVGVVYSGLRAVDESGQELFLAHAEAGSTPSGWIFAEQLRMPRISSPSAMVRRSVYDVVGVYEEDDPAEDYDMWLRISRLYQVLHIPDVLVNYRVHGGRVTETFVDEPFRRYEAACLRRHLGHSPETDEIIHERLRRLDPRGTAGTPT